MRRGQAFELGRSEDVGSSATWRFLAGSLGPRCGVPFRILFTIPSRRAGYHFAFPPVPGAHIDEPAGIEEVDGQSEHQQRNIYVQRVCRCEFATDQPGQYSKAASRFVAHSVGD